MTVIHADDLELLRTAVRGVFAGSAPETVPAALLDSGFAELMADTPWVATAILFEEQGSLLAASAALDLVALHALGEPPSATTAVTLPSLERRDAPPGTLQADGSLNIDGLLLQGHQRALAVAVPTRTPTTQKVAWIDPAAIEPVAVIGLDPALGLARVHATFDSTLVCEMTPGQVIDAISACQVALAHELVGVARVTLSRAIAHVLDRTQFGRPLAVHQTIKHRLADVAVAIAACEELLALTPQRPGRAFARTAKALAGRAALLACVHAMQVCGAMGFTREQGLHRYVRRAQMLDSLLGSTEWLTCELGADLLDARDVPRLVEL